MTTEKFIALSIAELAIIYRHQLSADEARVLTGKWFELLADLSDEQLAAAVRRHCRVSTFFPSPADIVAAHEENIAEARRANRPMIETGAEPKGRIKNSIQAAMLCAAIQGNKAADTFFEIHDYDQRMRIAEHVLGKDLGQKRGSGPRRAFS